MICSYRKLYTTHSTDHCFLEMVNISNVFTTIASYITKVTYGEKLLFNNNSIWCYFSTYSLSVIYFIHHSPSPLTGTQNTIATSHPHTSIRNAPLHPKTLHPKVPWHAQKWATLKGKGHKFCFQVPLEILTGFSINHTLP